MPLDPDAQVFGRLIRRMHNRERDPLRPLLDQYYIKRERSANRHVEVTLPLLPRSRPGGRLSPSAMGGCQRKAVLTFLGVKGRRHIDPDQESIFDDGNWRHFKWGAIFKDMEAVLGKEVFEVISIEKKCTIDGLYIAGSYDILVRIDGVLWLIDFKGINDAGFTRIMTTDEPLPKHVPQIVTYGKANRVKRLILFYENKNNNQTRSFIIMRTPELWEAARAWAQEVISYLERRRLPAKDLECQAGTFMYEKCPFAHLCYGHKDNEDLREMAYRRFVSIGAAWERGHEESA